MSFDVLLACFTSLSCIFLMMFAERELSRGMAQLSDDLLRIHFRFVKPFRHCLPNVVRPDNHCCEFRGDRIVAFRLLLANSCFFTVWFYAAFLTH
jgi:hypothetical protein